jgi:hypothetical protein
MHMAGRASFTGSTEKLGPGATPSDLPAEIRILGLWASEGTNVK